MNCQHALFIEDVFIILFREGKMEGKHEYKQLEQLKLERTDSSTPAPPNTPVSQGSGTNGPT
ncbi:hypothetical protein [uncultured Legionella sp.]|uniref:hypothetical protein n=1 Tax=uncultured Legionella sp. TaxID=210934 RepID=UPI00260676FF|nr:hypothetical protein [uncultured Legionella sp.]